MTTETTNAIAGILVDKFHVDRGRVDPDATLDGLGLDSLTLMEFVFAVEDAFSVRIPEDRLDPRQTGVTLGHFGELIEAEAAARAPKVRAA